MPKISQKLFQRFTFATTLLLIALSTNSYAPADQPPLTADINGNGKVDLLDLALLFEQWLSESGNVQAQTEIRIRSDQEFSIVLLPDTQNYSDYKPEVYNSQTQWIADNQDQYRIKFVLHEGDFTNHNALREWDNATIAMANLDNANVPYVAVPGNHDTGADGKTATRDMSYFNQYFPVSRFANLVDTYEPDHAENSYHYFTAGGTDWLVMALEFGPRIEILNWANSIVADHPHRRVIVVTHAYMYSDETRIGTGDKWNPHAYTVCQTALDDEVCNDGDEIWDSFVKRHPNISFVFSGHILNDGVGTLISTGENGNLVYQMLANYQFEDNGGNGYFRIVSFSPTEQKVRVQTYSPWLNKWRTEPDQQFEFSQVDLTTP